MALGYLYEEKEKRIKDLKTAYIGVLEILSKYLVTMDRYTKGHSVRVTYLAENIAKAIELSANEVETIKATALLGPVSLPWKAYEEIEKESGSCFFVRMLSGHLK